MSMSTRLYPLSYENEIKVWYPLNLGMEMWMNFFTRIGME